MILDAKGRPVQVGYTSTGEAALIPRPVSLLPSNPEERANMLRKLVRGGFLSEESARRLAPGCPEASAA